MKKVYSDRIHLFLYLRFSSVMKTKILKPDFPRFDAILKFVIAPRPICFVSTVDLNGNINLSPFSYFNIVSQHPPVCLFSPLRRMDNNCHKHTLDNLLEVPELVINIVNYPMVQQQSLASTEFPRGVNEFEKSGLTPLASHLVKPPRVAESPVQLECRVRQIIPIADSPGAGNLVLADILLMHVQEEQVDEDGRVDQAKLDLVARLGGDWYCRITEDNLFQVKKPAKKLAVGVEELPSAIRNSAVLTGNHLAMLASVDHLPAESESDEMRYDPDIQEILNAFIGDPSTRQIHLHRKAAELLDQGDVSSAWKVLLLS